VDAALKKLGIKLSAADLKLILNAVSWRVETAPPVIKKIHKPGKAKPDPLRGLFEAKVDGKTCVVEYEPDSELRDYEQIPLLEDGGIEAFIRREVLPYTPDAWLVEADTKIGYEVSFTRHFYQPPPAPHPRRDQRRHPRQWRRGRRRSRRGGQSKRPAEREFYLRMAVQERWSKRELERQFRLAAFERAVLHPPKLSPAVRQDHATAASVFKDAYVVEFLNLPDEHSEADLHRGLIARLKAFLIELGRDFCFIGSEYPVQVGDRDFALDLLFFHRGLNCLVAIELKVDRFEPEHLGKLNFYLEALDRDVKKPHENPAIGLLLCASKDSEVVEYALSRTLSPALVAQYQTQLPDKRLLAAKLHEFYVLNAPEQAEEEPARKVVKRMTKKAPNKGVKQ
jgi:predicted nuclease of restriction endonuclease-like (RecB) superfamily